MSIPKLAMGFDYKNNLKFFEKIIKTLMDFNLMYIYFFLFSKIYKNIHLFLFR